MARAHVGARCVRFFKGSLYLWAWGLGGSGFEGSGTEAHKLQIVDLRSISERMPLMNRQVLPPDPTMVNPVHLLGFGGFRVWGLWLRLPRDDPTPYTPEASCFHPPQPLPTLPRYPQLFIYLKPACVLNFNPTPGIYVSRLLDPKTPPHPNLQACIGS